MADDTKVRRSFGRTSNQLRPIKVTYDLFGYGAGAVLFELGNTKVLCAASIQNGVPPFLKGTRTGWLTAEYAMLPTATQIRTQRETAERRNGRSTEISRIIGRALRAVVKLDSIGERTIMIDCDVLQADGGTRTAAITGAWLALRAAEQRWLSDNMINDAVLLNDVAAISVGMVRGVHLLDLDCKEDNEADVDFNFVLTAAGNIVEIQGATEKSDALVTWADIDQLRALAISGINELFSTINVPKSDVVHERVKPNNSEKGIKKETSLPLFSLKNRLSNQS